MSGEDIRGFKDLEKGEITVGQEGFPRGVGKEVSPKGWEGYGEKGERKGILDWGRGGDSGNT